LVLNNPSEKVRKAVYKNIVRSQLAQYSWISASCYEVRRSIHIPAVAASMYLAPSWGRLTTASFSKDIWHVSYYL